MNCDERPATPLTDKLLIAARKLADALDKDAKANLRVPRDCGGVHSYSVRRHDETLAFSDTDGRARAERFAAQVKEQVCAANG